MQRTPIQKQRGDGSLTGQFNKSIGDIPEIKWRQIIEEQDYDTIILEMRDEILSRVLEECYRKYLKREMYKFITECAHKAFRQLIKLNFFKYDDTHKYASDQESWIADAEPEICKPDSWAQGNIPYNEDDIPQNKFQQTNVIFSDYELVKCDYPSSVFHTESNESLLEAGVGLDEEMPSPLVQVVQQKPHQETSQINVQFTNYNVMMNMDLEPSLQEILPHRNVSENQFYKIMRTSHSSSLSLQTSTSKKKNLPPSWTTTDEIKEELRKQQYGLSRYLEIRRACQVTVEQKNNSAT